MLALGRHLILELKESPYEVLDNLGFIEETLVDAAKSAGLTIVGQTFHKFAPQGVTGVVAIAESHICIHTWPEYGYAAVDIFTCGEAFNPHDAADIIVSKLSSANSSRTEIPRGIAVQPSEVSA